jgi:hypothetical protein
MRTFIKGSRLHGEGISPTEKESFVYYIWMKNGSQTVVGHVNMITISIPPKKIKGFSFENYLT